jgi:hypothetical protein
MTAADMVTRQIPAGSKNVRQGDSKNVRQARPMPATAAMSAALLSLAARDERTPCQGRYSELWTSENYTQRAETIPLCIGCDLLTLCAQYATELRASFGVWAGIDRTPTNRKKAAA